MNFANEINTSSKKYLSKMRPWNEIIAEARDLKKEKEEKQRRLKIAKTAIKGAAALDTGKKGKKGKGRSKLSADEIELKKRYQKTREASEARKKAQFDFTVQQAEKNKAKQLEKLKEKEFQSHKERAKSALANVKGEKISSKDPEGTAYAKAVGNVGSLAGGLAKAAVHGAAYALAKRKAQKEVESKKETKIPEKKEKKSGLMGGRPPGKSKTTTSGSTAPGSTQSGAPEPKRLVPATKRLPPVGGIPQGKPKALTLGQRARQNPKIKAGLMAQRNEEFSNWREEFLFEVDDKSDKKKKEKIVDVMRGKNKVEINPNIKESHKEIASGKEKDDEGYMVNIELDQMERAVKSLRKKVKRADTQLPAWVQSKITRAADYIDTASSYLMSDEKITEAHDDETFRQHSRETFSSHEPTESRKRTAGVLKLMKQMNADVEKPKKKKKKKSVAEECGCMDDKKKVLATAIFKKALSDKKKKNFQLNSEIIGEAKTAAWQRKEGKNPEGGLNKKGIASYRRENPGSKLSLAVTTPPSKLDPDSKAAKRRKSFCSRSAGQMKMWPKAAKDPNSRLRLSRRKWNC